MGLDDMLKQQIRDRAPELKQKLVNEFDELTKTGMDETGDDPDEIVDRVQQKTGQPREQVEQRVQKGDAEQLIPRVSPEHQRELNRCGRGRPHILGLLRQARIGG